ncbi:substrate-binding domain-containing protein [Thermopolyspora sp. NPDC052614]|uniref:sugar ABC transporter substrate-binding protein n=1 Tax=Thermopolyspora sp. NPDC052614 TaxID=3155682 RepID=UPI00341C8FD2
MTRPRRLCRLFGLMAGAALLAVLGGCGSGAAGPAGGEAEASAAVKRLEQEPVAIPITTPLPRKPEPGGTIAFLKCEVPQCTQQAQGFQTAAKAVGWRVVEIPFVTTDPASLAPAFRQALDLKPAAVAFGGMPYELWSRYLPDFQRIGAILVPNYVGPVPQSETVPVIAAGPVNDEAMAKSIARWVADDSGGKAHVLVQKISAYKAVVGWADAVKRELGGICPGCRVSEIENSATQITGAGAAQSIVSEIRRDPTIDYVIGYNGAFFGGLNQALANAQLNVKVGGLFPLPQNVHDVMNGSGGAFVAVNNQYAAWFSVDAALRHAQGAPPVSPAEQVFPEKLVTKASAKESDGDFAGPAGFEEQFLKLWKVR